MTKKRMEHRTRQEIVDLLRYGHIIPISKGYTRAHIAKHWPGWTWNELLAVWRAAGILVPGGSMLACNEKVQWVRFTGPEDVIVRWADGRLSTGLLG